MQQLTTNPDQPERTQTVTLGDRQFRVRLVFRDRTSSWYMDLFDAADVPMALGRRLSPSAFPTSGLQLVGKPDGALMVTGAEPYVRSDMGDTLVLQFIGADEVVVVQPEGPRIAIL